MARRSRSSSLQSPPPPGASSCARRGRLRPTPGVTCMHVPALWALPLLSACCPHPQVAGVTNLERGEEEVAKATIPSGVGISPREHAPAPTMSEMTDRERPLLVMTPKHGRMPTVAECWGWGTGLQGWLARESQSYHCFRGVQPHPPGVADWFLAFWHQTPLGGVSQERPKVATVFWGDLGPNLLIL